MHNFFSCFAILVLFQLSSFSPINASPIVFSKILQFADFHYDQDYTVNGLGDELCHNASSGSTVYDIGSFGNRRCDAPITLVKNAIYNAYKIVPDPEFILWTGDNVPHITGYNEDYVINAIKTTTNEIKKQFPSTLVLPAFGNHDYAPSDQFPDSLSNIYLKTFELWKPWIKKNSKETFLKGGYYKHVTETNALFLVLNTNLYYLFDNVEFTNPDDPADQFKFMEDTLKKAQAKKQVVHVIAHIAPGLYELKEKFSWFHPHYNKRFIDIVVEYAETIGWMVFGHHHSDTFHVVKNSKGEIVQVMFLSPAVTPWYSSLGNSSNNPSFRVFVRSKNWSLLDVKTYYVDLEELNENESTNWKLEYSFIKDYKLSPSVVNTESIQMLVLKLKKENDVFEQYFKHNSVMNTFPAPPLKSFSRHAHLCSIENVDLDDYNNCLLSFKEESDPDNPPDSSAVGVKPLFFNLFSSLIAIGMFFILTN